jgi:hypothetical protein
MIIHLLRVILSLFFHNRKWDIGTNIVPAEPFTIHHLEVRFAQPISLHRQYAMFAVHLFY